MKLYNIAYVHFFVCKAKDTGSAIDKCEKKYPNCTISEVQVYDEENNRWGDVDSENLT